MMKFYIHTFSLLVLTFNTNGLFAQPSPAWVKTYSAGASDMIRVMTTDAAGNIYVCGPSEAKKNNTDYAVVKYSPAGQELKVYRYNGDANGEDWPFALAVDNAGYVYVTGRSMGANSTFDIATVKFNPNGNLEWANTYNGASNQNDFGRALHIDAAGNVCVTGGADGPGTFAGNNVVTLKYNSQGAKQWEAIYNSVPDATDGSGAAKEEGNAIITDAEGNVYVAGGTTAGIVIRYSPDGAEERVAFPFGSNGKKLALHAGNLIMAGWGGVVVKFNPADLSVVWQQTDADETAYQDMTLDADGNIYVTGWARPGNTKDDYTTLKYNSGGARQWTRYYNGSANDIDLVHAIALDGDRNVFVTGYVRIKSGRSSVSQFGTVKYTTDGNQVWAALYIGSEKKGAEAFGIVTDADDNVYVGGQNSTKPSDVNFTTLRYSKTQTTRIGRHAPIVYFKLNTFPNPFHQNTTIEFELAEKGKVTLAVYDLLGKEITQLINEEKAPGLHKVNFNAGSLAAGTYLYRFQFGEIVETRRLVLVK